MRRLRLLFEARWWFSALLAGSLLAGCEGGRQGSGGSAGANVTWTDTPISFEVAGMPVFGTYRHPVDGPGLFPAALLIAGSGPTDRNGNSPLVSGNIGTLQTLADWLSDDGVASLRYDKLGSGQTGLGSYALRPQEAGMQVFEQEAAAAFETLASQPGIDGKRLMVLGHSEGALMALLLATGESGKTPPVKALGLIEPLSLRYLDAVSEQVDQELSTAQEAGQLNASQAGQLQAAVVAAVASIRDSATVPTSLPKELTTLFNPSTALFLSQADRYDPAVLASDLPRGMDVLVTCSDADIDVSCADVDRLVAGLGRARTATTFVHLSGVDHMLKEDSSRGTASYGVDLPFSMQLRDALRQFVDAVR